jgi:hypothetical protein
MHTSKIAVRRLYAAAFLAAALAQSSAKAQGAEPVLIQCESCAPALIEQVALGHGIYRDPYFEGLVHVADLAGNNLSAFNFRCVQREGYVPLRPMEKAQRSTAMAAHPATSQAPCIRGVVEPAAADPEFVDAFIWLRQFYVDSGGTMHKSFAVNVNTISGPHANELHGMTAYDVVMPGNNQALLRDSVTQHCLVCGFASAPALFARAGVSIQLSNNPVSSVRITFFEGSSIQLTRALMDPSGWQVVDGSARTSGGQLIPGPNAFLDEWRFGQPYSDSIEGARGLIDHLSGAFGATITGGIDPLLEKWVIVTCSRVGNGEWSCHIMQE